MFISGVQHRRKLEERKMNGKSLATGLVLGLAIGLSIGYFLPQVLPNLTNTSNSTNYAGYTTVHVNVAQITSQTFAGIKYSFMYTPDHIDNIGIKEAGYVSVVSELELVPATLPLTIGIAHDYYRIEVVISEVQSEYCTLMIKSITP
jgi:hypothetical protein